MPRQATGTDAAIAPAPEAAPSPIVAELVAALRAAVTATEPPPTPLTARVRQSADAIKAGATVVEAMQDAGYGVRFVIGRAEGWASWLASEGLLTRRQAETAAVGALPVIKPKLRPAPAPTDDEDDI